MAEEPIEDARARQYAVCTWWLRDQPRGEGTEAIFDQALTNGLAAIVAHDYPDELLRADGKVKSAAELLDVLQARGVPGPDGSVRLPHGDPDELWTDVPFSDEPMPNFTEVRVNAIRAAIGRVQPIRHAAGTPVDPVLTDDDLDALIALDNHAALFALSDEERDRHELRADRSDAAEYARARAYVEVIDGDEWVRRRMIDYAGHYARFSPDGDRVEVQPCPACGVTALVAACFDQYVEAVGVGACVACSYRRTQDVADLEGLSELLWQKRQPRR